MNRSRWVQTVVLMVLVGACSDPGSVAVPTTGMEPPTSTVADSTTTTSHAPNTQPAPSTSSTPPEMVWTESEAERDVENYLAALAAGAYEQAGWSLVNNGGVIEPDETVAESLARLCEDGACQGPYSVEADGPGFEDPVSAQASSTVTVTHPPTGAQTTIDVFTFEGQRIVSGVPPLVPSPPSPSLVERLFGDDLPDRVVVQRFGAFEIWEDGAPTSPTGTPPPFRLRV